MKKLALITLHGMGPERPDYYHRFESKLKKRLGRSWEWVSFHPIDYAPILQEPQNTLWDRYIKNPKNDLDYQFLRKFLLYGFGDAGTLEHSASRDLSKYLQVEEKIQEALLAAYQALDKDPNRPVVIIAHSLGAQVISNYLWDAQKNRYIFENSSSNANKEEQFLKLKNLHQLITLGCNIPVFNAGLEHPVCFDKPHDDFRWHNFYDPDDILGWPMRDLGPSYDFIEDIAINVGTLFTFWNPLSHDDYWKDSSTIKSIEKLLRPLLR